MDLFRMCEKRNEKEGKKITKIKEADRDPALI